MTAERWPMVRDLFEKCVECAPERRKALLDRAEGEPEVMQEVLTLLRCHDEMERDLLRAARDNVGPPAGVLAIGELIAGRFETRRFIGQGGMGEVYEAYDKHLGELVALKVLRASLQDDSAATTRLVRELQLARRISHVTFRRDIVDGTQRSAPEQLITWAQQCGVPLLDLTRFESTMPARQLTLDGVHLSAQGNRIVAKALESNWGAFDPQPSLASVSHS